MAAITGCGSSSSSSGSGSDTGGKTLTIGFSSVLSGPASVYSEVTQGAQAYFKLRNDQGGVNGYKFKFKEKDNAYSTAQSVAVARELANSNVFEILVAGTPPVQAVKPIAAQLGVPIMAAANGDFFVPPIKNFFGENPRYSRLPLFDAQFILQHLHETQFALAYQNDDVGTPASKVVPQYLEAHGGKILTSVPVDAGTTDFSALASRLKRSGATVVEAFLGTSPFAGLQKAAAAIGYHPTWVTLFTQLTPGYTDLVGKLADGVYVNEFLNADGPELATFKAGMTKYAPKLTASFLAEQGWTMAAITAKGIEQATQGDAKLTKDSYLAALNSFSGVPAGLLPSVTYGPQSHAAATKAAMYKYTGTSAKAVMKYEDIPSLGGN
jgi:branched-chain amino acid transport system substrate-binding protein